MKKFEGEFHEKAIVLESQFFYTKPASHLGSANIFPSDKAFSPGAIFIPAQKKDLRMESLLIVFLGSLKTDIK